MPTIYTTLVSRLVRAPPDHVLVLLIEVSATGTGVTCGRL